MGRRRRVKTIKRICTKKWPSHKKSSQIITQLKNNPEVCENCPIHPCTFILYLYGDGE